MKNTKVVHTSILILALFICNTTYSQWLNNGSKIYYNNGKVGIGTSNPTSSLQINNPTYARLAMTATSPSTNVRMFIDARGTSGNNRGQLGTFSNHPLYFYTNSNARMVIKNNGMVGIGTTNPTHELTVQGNDPALVIRDDTSDNSTNAARLELLERAGGNYNGGAFLWWNGNSNKLLIGTKVNGTNSNVLVINRSGLNVGIGTSNPDNNYRLAVNGKIRAKEIVVETGWADFVFEKDYKLKTLEEVETFIQNNGHLPDIPSAKEVAENGVKVGEMESKLLQKIEELTLYMIDLEKKVAQMESHISNTLKNKSSHEK